jgi:predicted RNA-binding protein with PIN domain
MFVIDGYNLLGVLRTHPGALPANESAARERMLALLAHTLRGEAQGGYVFFDGVANSAREGDLSFTGLRIKFCGPASGSADRAICDFVENHHAPRELRVVSDDHEVKDTCRLAGARVVTSRHMAQRLARLSSRREATQEAPEKPQRGAMGRIEQDMLEDIVEELGDFFDEDGRLR